MEELIKQAPYIAALVIIVFGFFNAQAKRDAIFLEHDKVWQTAVTALTDQMRLMQEKLTEHSEETSAGINEMHRTVKRGTVRKSNKK